MRRDFRNDRPVGRIVAPRETGQHGLGRPLNDLVIVWLGLARGQPCCDRAIACAEKFKRPTNPQIRDRRALIPTVLIIDLKSPNLSFRWT